MIVEIILRQTFSVSWQDSVSGLTSSNGPRHVIIMCVSSLGSDTRGNFVSFLVASSVRDYERRKGKFWEDSLLDIMMLT